MLVLTSEISELPILNFYCESRPSLSASWQYSQSHSFLGKNHSEMKCNLVEYETPELHFRSRTSDLTHTNNNNSNKTNKLVGDI